MTETEALTARLLDVLPPHAFELLTFLSLFRVRLSDETETASVTCGDAPELLLNKAFLEVHCRRDEHLLMLVLHELYHVILGHTRLFPRATPLHNLVFDAVINALLCARFPAPEYTSFFTQLYPPDEMPYALLRPKGPGTPPEAEAILKLLYEADGTVTYADLFQLLLNDGGLQGLDLDSVPLLGSHGPHEEKAAGAVGELLREILAHGPGIDLPHGGRGDGHEAEEQTFVADASVPPGLAEGIRELMRHAELPGKRERLRRALRRQPCESVTFLPNWRDRSHAARELTLGDALLYRSTVELPRPISRDRRLAFVYFDVSGSVQRSVPAVARALLPYCRRGLCTLHVFSTEVHPATARDLAASRFTSTGGTDITCVLEHLLALPPRRRPRAAILITDGEVGNVSDALRKRLRESGIRLLFGLVQTLNLAEAQRDLADLADTCIRLS